MANRNLLEDRIMTFVGASNADSARAFYRDTLGLRLQSEDEFALVFDVGGVMLRVTLIGEVHPQPHTVLGWQVRDAAVTARKLAAAGIPLERYSHVEQDEEGVWAAPGGSKIAWFKDPDGNVLSIAQM